MNSNTFFEHVVVLSRFPHPYLRPLNTAKKREICQVVEILLAFMLKIAQEVYLASTHS